ncbi:pyridoxal phosphate-dependent transferase [Apodospora peruviana]|uniref:Pyridoxal phosphate-dependent transferase n=1 Tax=Apodospora peruviana TaxID=516989 RepID=A0AAE0IAS9_9PEZI|nr:pyridoxal phosphate-dependent transferase [Apodospora peruviana]
MNGTHLPEPLNRANEVEHLIDAVKALIIPFIGAADEAAPAKATAQLAGNNQGVTRNVLVESCKPEELVKRLDFSLPKVEGRGEEGLLQTIKDILEHSVNTWDQGFLDKLYASTNAVGVASELLLSVLNTNLHVYQVSPALTVVEKHTARAFANLFGFDGPRAGGISCQGGSASNLTSIVIARNALYPETKTQGNSCASGPFILFTSAHGHYSVEKAAVTCGFGSSAVWTVPVDAAGRMDASALRGLVVRAKAEGRTPLYVNATAGTTVLGSYDPFEEIAAVCRDHGLWMHIDGSWGGPAIFSAKHRGKLAGAHLANSLTVNPHKMMNAPVTCSFLLTPDVAVFHKANTLPAGYLFHGPGDDDEVWDLADLTLQCGRRGDSLKLALSWIYYGAAGFERQIDGAFETAAYLADLVASRSDFVLVSSNPPPCLQVCFYYAPGGLVADEPEENTRRTRVMVCKLVARGFMIDYAPGDRGSFFRVVVNCQTLRGTVDGLVKALEAVGKEVAAPLIGALERCP